MKKYVVLTLVVFMFTLPAMASAHTYLSDSNPQEGEVVEEHLQEIELYYETRIERASTFDLVNEQEEVIPVDISVENDTMTGTLSEPLPDGVYTIEWRIIGADSHVITGEFTFEVTGQENATNEETTDETTGNGLEGNEDEDVQQETEQDHGTEEANENEMEPTEQEIAETEQSNERFPWAIVVVIVLLLVVALFSVRWLARRK